MARSMPKDLKLTWQEGGNGRQGRWKKFYRGKYHYFSGGRGKSDRDAYDAALAAFEKKKIQLDGAAPKPHQEEYEKVIQEWESVRLWCRENGEPQWEEIAAAKLDDLRKRLAGPKPSKIVPADTFEGQFEWGGRFPGWEQAQAKIERALADGRSRLQENASPEMQPVRDAMEELLQGVDTSQFKPIDASQFQFDEDPLRTQRTVWRDRLEVMQRTGTPADQSIAAYVDRFLTQKRAGAKAGEIAITRTYILRLHLEHFRDWLGGSAAIGKIDSQALMNYRISLLGEVTKGAWSMTTANNRMGTIKTFVRWLWQGEALEVLPRVLDGPALNIAKTSPEVVTYTTAEIRTLLCGASERTRLYILLMLNCGMTQKDIADLLHTEVDWQEGRIVRRRSKTKKHRNVPVVSYRLWEETLVLLRQEKSRGTTGRVLTNQNGSPLVFDDVDEQGKSIKCDNVRSAFNRLCKKTSISKSLTSFKKTSATLLRGNRHYSSLDRVFLGHAPASMSDKHYTKIPQDLLDEAVLWLRDELKIKAALAPQQGNGEGEEST